MNEINFERECAKVIYCHKSEFDSYVFSKQKLQAVKALKDYTGAGLKECKDVIEDYFDGILKSYIIEERKQKLEVLAKKPLVEELVNKIKSLSSDNLQNMLMNLSVDDLFNIDEIIEKI